MKAYQERVVNEQNALDEKIELLTEFLKDTNSRQIVCPIELERMDRQLDLMVKYSAVLGERIKNFK
jgi:hypothetical protein